MRLETQIDGNLLLLRIANSPANSLSLPLRRQLYDTLTTTTSNSQIASVIIHGADRYFCAGADLHELGTPAANAVPRLSADILPAVESCAKPVIAALHGAAIGGGFELALACHYRIAAHGTRIALPELKHGIIPLSGTQRLPRLWGIDRALRMMMDSIELSADDFAGSSVFDRIVDGTDLLPQAVEFARALPRGRHAGLQHAASLVRNRPYADVDPRAALAGAAARYPKENLTSTQAALMAAVRAGVELNDFDEGLAESQRIFDGLSAAMGHH